ncbi:MAG: UDP-N-acetylglucosamine--N-acetylmuramyl-(pentapeptide) pyrophosphoryl-undecaprenol N-acetylglucosamine transferase [Chloroflexi bacterium]|nr:UDP-N-acetylglucosamine--N-acetylmuramyl-(pentapeptide) pyrophosphoryl-undecaprenol N-acetylglucosamine transferase [Chloroflexota bacterium]
MRIAVTGGGSGGHIYPALSVVDAVRVRMGAGLDRSDLMYLGNPNGMERGMASRANLPFRSVHSGQMRGRSRMRLAINALVNLRGVVEAAIQLRRFGAQTVLATGGYVSAPVILAAWMQRIPVVIYLPDIEPGMAIKFLARFAWRIAVTNEAARAFLPADKVIVTGYPVRDSMRGMTKSEARQQFPLDPNDRVLLALGGSQGAHSINEAVRGALPDLLALTQVLHICGPDDESALRDARDALPETLRRRYLLYRYLHDDMPAALAASDLAVSRSGASVMGEYSAVGLPSVLVPYPHAGSHQRHNAVAMAEAGAAQIVENSAIGGVLLPSVRALFAQPEELERMGRAAREMDRPHAAGDIANLLLQQARASAARTTAAATGGGR